MDGGFFIPYESEGKINNKIKTGDTVEIDTLENIIILSRNGEEYNLKELGSVLPIVEAGGIFEYARKNKMI